MIEDLILAAVAILIALFVFWCDWQNSCHNRVIHRGFWNHTVHRIFD